MSGLSVKTIKSPEFINITSVSPLISKCEIKVLYTGSNRNHSYITKEVATEIAQTLPGVPIVGYYSENKEDFRDHGDQMTIDGDGIKFSCLTKPYGFVSLDTKVWFQEFEDTDEFGNICTREYLMCEGYLWTEQYKEAKMVLEEGRPHSMELDESTLKGHWSTDNNRGIEFFIIDDAIFSKLCILGEDVEPCFEGSSVTAPDVSSSFTLKDDEFVKTMFSMMEELKELTYSLQNKGGEGMEILEENSVQTPEENFTVEESVTVETVEDTTEEVISEVDDTTEEAPASDSTEEIIDPAIEDFVENEDKSNQEINTENQETIEEFTKTEETEDFEQKYTVLEQSFNELNEKYSLLEQENAELKAFKKEVEDKEKDALIDSFYMLSDEDKKHVIENKSNYSLDDIEKELSVICVRKRVSFDNNDNTMDTEPSSVLTYNFNNTEEEVLPAWLKAVADRAHNN